MVITYLVLVLLLGIITFAYPKVRSVAHDNFERTHRFLGWTAVFLVWALVSHTNTLIRFIVVLTSNHQIVLLTNDYRMPGQTLGHALIHAPPFWLVAILTISIILPWLRLRKVPVRAEVLSTHAVRLYFDYGKLQLNVATMFSLNSYAFLVTPVTGSFTRISESPLFEWHGFATIPEPGMKGYSLVVSRAGDWTSRQIENPPTSLWVRGIPTCGVIRIVPLFRRVVLVATGSGIGPCAPAILEKRVPMRLLWTSPDVRKTFGDKLVDSIIAAEPNAVIYG